MAVASCFTFGNPSALTNDSITHAAVGSYLLSANGFADQSNLNHLIPNFSPLGLFLVYMCHYFYFISPIDSNLTKYSIIFYKKQYFTKIF